MLSTAVLSWQLRPGKEEDEKGEEKEEEEEEEEEENLTGIFQKISQPSPRHS